MIIASYLKVCLLLDALCFGLILVLIDNLDIYVSRLLECDAGALFVLSLQIKYTSIMNYVALICGIHWIYCIYGTLYKVVYVTIFFAKQNTNTNTTEYSILKKNDVLEICTYVQFFFFYRRYFFLCYILKPLLLIIRNAYIWEFGSMLIKWFT